MKDATVTLDTDSMVATVRRGLEQFSPSLHPQALEVEFFVRAFRSAIALRAVNIALDEKLKGNRVEVTQFEFAESGELKQLPTREFVAHIRNASGLPTDACQSALAALTSSIRNSVRTEGSVTISGVGLAHATDAGGAVLELDDSIAIRPSRRSAIAAQPA